MAVYEVFRNGVSQGLAGLYDDVGGEDIHQLCDITGDYRGSKSLWEIRPVVTKLPPRGDYVVHIGDRYWWLVRIDADDALTVGHGVGRIDPNAEFHHEELTREDFIGVFSAVGAAGWLSGYRAVRRVKREDR
jgi:hypothetical protein